MPKSSLDQLDLTILEKLHEDGRTPFTEIAQLTGVSEGTVRNRVARLVKEGVIHISGLINPGALGYESPAVVGISVQPSKVEQVAEKIASFDEVSYLVMVSGEFDLFVEVICRDRAHLADFLSRKLQQVDGLTRTQTFVTLKTYKMAYGSLPISEKGIQDLSS